MFVCAKESYMETTSRCHRSSARTVLERDKPVKHLCLLTRGTTLGCSLRFCTVEMDREKRRKSSKLFVLDKRKFYCTNRLREVIVDRFLRDPKGTRLSDPGTPATPERESENVVCVRVKKLHFIPKRQLYTKDKRNSIECPY